MFKFLSRLKPVAAAIKEVAVGFLDFFYRRASNNLPRNLPPCQTGPEAVKNFLPQLYIRGAAVGFLPPPPNITSA
jgi:hypothetical protein